MLDVSGEIHIEVRGEDLTQLKNEAGCHKIQRVPPTERNGRVHTSAVTVAIIDPTQFQVEDFSEIASKDLKIEWYSGTGCGGQNRNKVQTSCRLTHIPTNTVQTAQTRSRENSYAEALVGLKQSLAAASKVQTVKAAGAHKQQQMGNGSNSNVVRTYCFQHGFIKDTEAKKLPIGSLDKGQLDRLW